eukprot:s3216_g5.t3
MLRLFLGSESAAKQCEAFKKKYKVDEVAVLCCSYCGCFRTRNQGSWWPALQLLWAEAGALIACEYGTSTESCLWATIARSTAELRPWEDFVGSDSTSLMSATMLLGWLAQEQVVFCEDWEDEETGATKCACGPPVPADGSKSDLLNGRLMPGAPTAARKLLHLVAEIILAGDAANMQKLYTAVMANEDWQVLYSCTSQASSPQRYLILDRGNMELPANARQRLAETLEPIAADELFESFEDRSYLSQSDVPVKRLNVTARVFPFVANQLNSSYVMGRNRAPSCWIASQADLNSGLLERVVQALHNPRSKQPHPKLLDLSVGSATADRRKATVTDCNRSISASSIGESWKSRCAPFDFRAMLDIITILSAAGLQQELKSVNGDKSLVIHEDLRIENCRRNPDLTASPRAQAEEETSFVESAAGHVSTALETFDDAVAQGWSALFGNSESSAEMQPQPKKGGLVQKTRRFVRRSLGSRLRQEKLGTSFSGTTALYVFCVTRAPWSLATASPPAPGRSRWVLFQVLHPDRQGGNLHPHFIPQRRSKAAKVEETATCTSDNQKQMDEPVENRKMRVRASIFEPEAAGSQRGSAPPVLPFILASMMRAFRRLPVAKAAKLVQPRALPAQYARAFSAQPEAFKAAYEAHVAERAAEGGMPPLALDSSQAESVVEMLKKAPADGAFYVDLLRNRVNPGVDDSSYVKANFLRDIIHGTVSTPLVSKADAVEMLGWMQGGYNVAPLVEALDLDQDLASGAVTGLSRMILMFDAYHDVEDKMKKGNPFAKQVIESWANADWFTSRPTVPEKVTLCVFKVTGETNTDDLSPAPDAWSRPDTWSLLLVLFVSLLL